MLFNICELIRLKCEMVVYDVSLKHKKGLILKILSGKYVQSTDTISLKKLSVRRTKIIFASSWFSEILFQLLLRDPSMERRNRFYIFGRDYSIFFWRRGLKFLVHIQRCLLLFRDEYTARRFAPYVWNWFRIIAPDK